ncbi:MAG: NUDIX hydrolase [Myxococcota bacterium]
MPGATHCSRCGGALVRRVPPGEDRPRDVCERCGTIHYENPRVVVGTAVERGDEVLLCRRAIEPRRGFWTLPAGFLELGESTVDGARRETFEETGVRVDVVAPLVCFDIVRIGQIFMIYRAALRSPDDGAHAASTSESLEVRWFPWPELPWDELAFDATRFALERLAADRAAGRPRAHYGTLGPKVPGVFGPWGTTIVEQAWSVALETRADPDLGVGLTNR